MNKVVYPNLSYNIVKCLYDSYNKMGYGYQEKYYQKALEKILFKNNINFKKELYCPISINGVKIGNYRLDFLIENKIAVELKVAGDFYKKDVLQVLAYLRHNKLILGLLVIYTKNGLKYKRILKGK